MQGAGQATEQRIERLTHYYLVVFNRANLHALVFGDFIVRFDRTPLQRLVRRAHRAYVAPTRPARPWEPIVQQRLDEERGYWSLIDLRRVSSAFSEWRPASLHDLPPRAEFQGNDARHKAKHSLMGRQYRHNQ